MKYYLAIDIGASSGRHIIGYKVKNEIKTEEIYRFPNFFDETEHGLTWDVERLFNEIKKGIKIALSKYPKIESISIDTWGVDYVLLDENDKEILPVYAYRDNRTKKVIDLVHKKISFEELFKISGSQFQEFNTIYQMYDDKLKGRLDRAKSFLMLPEYFIYKLTGIKVHEYTNSSTTGLLDIKEKRYSHKIIEQLGFDKELFGEVSEPGISLGNFKKEIADELGGNIEVRLVATHDTASAIEGVDIPFNTPYISSGTWSLLGIKVNDPIRSDDARKLNYSNEAGPNYYRFQKNIMGLWIVQGLQKEIGLSFQEMVNLAKISEFCRVFDVNDSRLFATNDMKKTITEIFKEQNIEGPISDGDFINCAYHSLAYSYKVALDELEKITNTKFEEIYILGGGAKNSYLNDLTAYYTKRKVKAFPIEATSFGNLKIQMEFKKWEKM